LHYQPKSNMIYPLLANSSSPYA